MGGGHGAGGGGNSGVDLQELRNHRHSCITWSSADDIPEKSPFLHIPSVGLLEIAPAFLYRGSMTSDPTIKPSLMHFVTLLSTALVQLVEGKTYNSNPS